MQSLGKCELRSATRQMEEIHNAPWGTTTQFRGCQAALPYNGCPLPTGETFQMKSPFSRSFFRAIYCGSIPIRSRAHPYLHLQPLPSTKFSQTTSNIPMSSHPLSTCATNGSAKRYAVTLTSNVFLHLLSSNTEMSILTYQRTSQSLQSSTFTGKMSPYNSEELSDATFSSSEDPQLLSSRLADYLEHPTASHVQPRHNSAEESKRLLHDNITHLRGIEKSLRGNNK